MKNLKHGLSKCLLAVMPALLIPAFISCGGPTLEENGPVISPWELEWAINISIEAGDGFVTLLNSSPVVMQKGGKWESIKAEAEKKVSFISGYEFASWHLEAPDGQILSDTHVFETHSKVFVRSKAISLADKITVTVKSNEQMKVAGGQASLVINKNKPWSEVRNQAEGLIIADAGYEIDKWMLGTPPMGAELQDSHMFAGGETIYATAKKLAETKITIKVAGDSNITVSQPQHIDVERGSVWGKVKKLAEAKVSVNPGYVLGKWRLNTSESGELKNDYVFNEHSSVYVESAPLPENKAHLILTHDEHLRISGSKFISIERNAKWSSLRGEIEGRLSAMAGYKLKGWLINGKGGTPLTDGYQFSNAVTTIFAESQADSVTPPPPGPEEPKPEIVIITIKAEADSYVLIDDKEPPSQTQIIKLAGTSWNEVHKEMIGRAKTKDPRKLVWGLSKYSGNLPGSYKIEKNTTIYVRGKLPEDLYEPTDPHHPTLVSIGGVSITGQDFSYLQMPKTYVEYIGDNSSDYVHYRRNEGVFTKGNNITLSPYKIDKYEVRNRLFKLVYKWALNNGYTFSFDPEGEDSHVARNTVGWTNAVTWCNAYTEMTIGKEHCVYRSKKTGEALKMVTEDIYFDQTKKGYRLPTEAEWEYAARWQGFEGDSVDKTNAEKYGNVYLTKLNSASGAKKPVPAEYHVNIGYTAEELMKESNRVAGYQMYWNGRWEFNPDRPDPSHMNIPSVVGQRHPNALGLYDMSGNLSELCYDCWDARPNLNGKDPYTPHPSNRYPFVIVWRGGHFHAYAYETTVGFRCTDKDSVFPEPGVLHGSNVVRSFVGFRVACYQ